jgi:hypothetical protein
MLKIFLYISITFQTICTPIITSWHHSSPAFNLLQITNGEKNYYCIVGLQDGERLNYSHDDLNQLITSRHVTFSFFRNSACFSMRARYCLMHFFKNQNGEYNARGDVVLESSQIGDEIVRTPVGEISNRFYIDENERVIFIYSLQDFLTKDCKISIIKKEDLQQPSEENLLKQFTEQRLKQEALEKSTTKKIKE